LGKKPDWLAANFRSYRAIIYATLGRVLGKIARAEKNLHGANLGIALAETQNKRDKIRKIT